MTMENAFEAPQADLETPSEDKPILEFTRFSAWWVLLLNIVTLGFYGMYWFYTRINKSNALAEKQVAMYKLWLYVGFGSAANIISTVMDEGDVTLALVSGVFTILGIIFYVLTAFGLRAGLSELINKGSAETVGLNGILTFFFSTIYFQYKINQAIDKQQ